VQKGSVFAGELFAPEPTYSGRGHLRRIEGRTLADHLAAIKRYWNAVADLL
jgi:hypothetical protein